MFKAPKWYTVLQYTVMIIVALFMFFPIYWIFVNSLKTLTGISSAPSFFPSDPQWENYKTVLSDPSTLLYLRNTLILCVANTAGTLLSSSLVAYPLSRMRFRGRGVVFAIIIATMMVPTATLIIPQYLLFRAFGMLDSFWPLILPSFFAQPYNVFLFRQFFVSIPESIDEAAMLDGCNRWQAFWRVIVPLGKPIFITVGIMSASFWWNELFSPLVFINSDELKPLTVGALTSFQLAGGGNQTNWPLQMAFSMLMILPPAILYICCSKYITDGIKTSGMKD
ncbi:ABC transporter permease [Bifidobacterium lemurum]|uniref:ABC transporter permease n=1 Tax=Bifidobacterium lemurum TaxID=1603886 RepID=A0A261FTZ1_9BIFI|nr:carbohydrate ABC transporter permease [Bifidobacterium lemurum]OZG62652.1 ABC transporter permease [Bifidobacterium lemurum]QOL34626.1 carbohydrate ABC transporter permease [Bifidobacterium lemurum]